METRTTSHPNWTKKYAFLYELSKPYLYASLLGSSTPVEEFDTFRDINKAFLYLCEKGMTLTNNQELLAKLPATSYTLNSSQDIFTYWKAFHNLVEQTNIYKWLHGTSDRSLDPVHMSLILNHLVGKEKCFAYSMDIISLCKEQIQQRDNNDKSDLLVSYLFMEILLMRAYDIYSNRTSYLVKKIMNVTEITGDVNKIDSFIDFFSVYIKNYTNILKLKVKKDNTERIIVKSGTWSQFFKELYTKYFSTSDSTYFIESWSSIEKKDQTYVLLTKVLTETHSNASQGRLHAQGHFQQQMTSDHEIHFHNSDDELNELLGISPVPVSSSTLKVLTESPTSSSPVETTGPFNWDEPPVHSITPPQTRVTSQSPPVPLETPPWLVDF